MSADQQQQNDDQAPEGTDEDQTPPADQDKGTDKPASRQERRDQQARERAAELEGERDQLAARIETYQRREVERIAGEVLEQAEDLFAVGGVKLEDVLTEDGEVDADAVAAAAAGLVDSRPGLAAGATPPRGYSNWGHAATSDPYFRDGPGYEGEGETSWAGAFGAAGRGGRHYT